MSRTTDPTAASSSPRGDSANGNGNGHGNGAAKNGNGSAHSNGNAPASSSTVSPRVVREGLAGKHVCPFCGTLNGTPTDPCPRCTMEDTPATRQATKSRIGPWYVLQTRNPAAPGMKFGTLLSLVSKGQVSPRSVLRGPTTHQLWRFAAHVRGLSREFGLCYSCGEAISRTAPVCPHCERPQEPPANVDALLESREAMAASPRVTPTPGVRPPSNARPMQQPEPEIEAPAVPNMHASSMHAGEHSQRLRVLNEGVSRSPRPDLRAPGNNRAVSAMELASALNPNGLDMDEERSYVGRALATLVVVALIGGSIFLYLYPDQRKTFFAWSASQWNSTREKVNRFELQKPAPAPSGRNGVSSPTIPDTAEGDPTLASQRQTPIDTKTDSSSSAPVPNPLDAASAVGTSPDIAHDQPVNQTKSNESNADRGTASRKRAGETKTKPPVVETKQPEKQTPQPEVKQSDVKAHDEPQPDATVKTEEPKSEPKRQDPPPVQKKEEPKPVTPPAPAPKDEPTADSSRGDSASSSADDIDQARALWNRAIDLEGRGNYAEAVRCYEKIKRLPRSAWPGGLDRRIDIAKAHIER